MGSPDAASAIATLLPNANGVQESYYVVSMDRQLFFLVFLLYLFYNPTRITHCYRVGGDILCHHTSGTNGHIVANRDPRQDGHAAAYPAVIANGHSLRPFLTSVALRGIGAVAGRVDTYIRTYEAVIPNGDRCFVQYHPIKVGKEALANPDMLAKVAHERLIDKGILIRMTEYLS